MIYKNFKLNYKIKANFVICIGYVTKNKATYVTYNILLIYITITYKVNIKFLSFNLYL